MTPKEYEAYVERLVREFKFASGAVITRNKRFRGVRQPGAYEVDIAVEAALDAHVIFRMLVECKYHRRRVTRPVVQLAAHTRDAIAFNKAAIASPSGFTKEAVEVAKALSVALWVMAEDVPTRVIMGFRGPYISPFTSLYYELRLEYLGLFGISPAGDSRVKLLDASRTEPVPGPSNLSRAGWDEHYREIFARVRKNCAFYRPTTRGSPVADREPERLFDSDSAQAQIAQWLVEAAREEMSPEDPIHVRIARWQASARQRIGAELLADEAIEKVESGDRDSFVDLLDKSGGRPSPRSFS